MESNADYLRRPVVYLKGTASFVMYLVCAIFIPLALRKAYMTYGLSCEFVNCFVVVLMLVVSLARLGGGRIGMISFNVIMITLLIRGLALLQLDCVFSLILVGAVFLVGIFFVVMVSCDKCGDVEDYPLPVTVKKETGGDCDIV